MMFVAAPVVDDVDAGRAQPNRGGVRAEERERGERSGPDREAFADRRRRVA